MTIVYKGMRRMTTDVLADYGQAHYLQNVRLKRVGEMGRRAGLGKSNMAQLAGPVQFMIGGWSNVPFIINGTGGSITGTEDPLAHWTAATLRIPGGVGGGPQPWTIAPTVPGGGAVTLPALAKAGTISFVASSNVCFFPGEGVTFYLYIDGVFTYQTACMVNGSDSFPVPVLTSSVEVTMALGCNGGPSATTALFSGAST